MNNSRHGTFSSSSIYKLMSNGRKAGEPGSSFFTYIEEKRYERKLGRQLTSEINTDAITWGNFLQNRVTDVLLRSDCKPNKDKIRRVHPLIQNWTGVEDYLRFGETEADTITGEIKCLELKNFCRTHDAATAGWNTLKEECEDVAWQLVSNAILCGTARAELLLYVPYLKELSAIKDEARDSDNHFVQRISFKSDEELPYLVEGKYYKNLTIFVFEIPEADKINLLNRVIMAEKLLTV